MAEVAAAALAGIKDSGLGNAPGVHGLRTLPDCRLPCPPHLPALQFSDIGRDEFVLWHPFHKLFYQ